MSIARLIIFVATIRSLKMRFEPEYSEEDYQIDLLISEDVNDYLSEFYDEDEEVNREEY